MNFLKFEFSKDIKKNYLDLISKNNKFINDPFYLKTLNLWGKGIHVRNKKKHKVNDTHIEKLLIYFKLNKFAKSYLEIGCGEGIDIKYIVNNFNFIDIFAIDIGENIKKLSEKKEFDKVFFCRCDCLDLPFENERFDIVYSYGVFHHTKNFENAILEAKRVLNKGGMLIFYSYKKHTNYFKSFGVGIETLLLKLFSKLSYNIVKLLCWFISPFILISFSYPAQILKFFGSKKKYKYFPLWWGKKPNDIIHDLLDRLYAPINIRFSEKQMYNQLLKVGFNKVKVHQTRDGLFCQVIK